MHAGLLARAVFRNDTELLENCQPLAPRLGFLLVIFALTKQNRDLLALRIIGLQAHDDAFAGGLAHDPR